MRLLDRAVHEHGATRAELDGVLRVQPEPSKIRNRIPERVGKRLNERAATRRASLVEHYVVDCLVFNLEALDVLTADVDNKVDVGTEFERGGKVRDGFDYAVIELQARFYQLFAIARNRRGGYRNSLAHESVELLQFFGDDVERLAAVFDVVAEKKLLIFGQEHDLGRGRACVYAQVRLAAICTYIAAANVRAAVTVDKLVVVRL